MQSSRWTFCGQSQLPEVGLKWSPEAQDRLTPPEALVHWIKSPQTPLMATIWPAAVHSPNLPGEGRTGASVTTGLLVTPPPPPPLVGVGGSMGGSTGTLPLKRTSTMPLRRGYLPSPQKDPLKSSKSKAQIMPPARPLSLMYWALMPMVLTLS